MTFSDQAKKRVMLFIHSMNGGGSERQMSYLANELSSCCNVCLLTLAQTSSAYPLDSRICQRALNLTSSTRGIFQGITANRQRIIEIRKAVREWKPHLFISFCDTNNILALASVAKDVPVVISERSDPRKQRLSLPWEWMRRRTYKKCAACVVQTADVGSYFTATKLLRESQVRIIPSAVRIPKMNLESLEDSRDRSPQKKLTFVGRLSSEKQVERLLKAWSLISPYFDDWVLRIVGDGPCRNSLQILARDLNIDSTVQWNMWSSDVWKILEDSHAFCLVSKYEGFPQSVLEAMAAALPVVVSDCSPAIREVVTDQCGKIVPHDFSDAQLADALSSVMRDPSSRAMLGRYAANRAVNYDWDRLKTRWLDLLCLAKDP